MDVNTLATIVDRKPSSVRQFLRKNYPDVERVRLHSGSKKAQGYGNLPEEVVQAAIAHFSRDKERSKKKYPLKGKAKEKEQRKHQREISKAERIRLELAGLVNLETGELLPEE